MSIFLGEVFRDRYRIQSLLGRQIGRRAFLATDLQTQATVVLKLMFFDPDFTWEIFKLFEREAQTLTNLEHPAIPTYIDFFEVETPTGKGFALVQSYIEARSLQDWVEVGRSFDETELRAITHSLLEILNYLHRRNPPVIHRDIKPSNILLGDPSNNSQVYLVDFGSVQAVQQSGTLTIVGTYGYMPPEQFAGRAHPTSDLYSLGATLIYLLTGTHPAELPSRRGCIQFEQVCVASDAYKRWLKCMTQVDIESRFLNAQVALEALQDDTLTPHLDRDLDRGKQAQLVDTSPITPFRIRPSQRPENAVCKIDKRPECLEISTPAANGYPSEGCSVFFILFVVLPLFVATITEPLLTLPLVLSLMLFWRVCKNWTQSKQLTKIIFKVDRDQNGAFLLKQSHNGRRRCLKSIPLRSIHGVQFVYSSSNSSQYQCHVELTTANNTYEPFLVGNHKFWLSQPEAYWLAYELSDWLALPVSVREVVFVNSQ
ncbi:MAG: serine/threonine-protein kinase [Cyanobacteria bacterium J06621_11]